MCHVPSDRAHAHQTQVNNSRWQPHPQQARPSTSRNEAFSSMRTSTSQLEQAGRPSMAKRSRTESEDMDPLEPRPEMLPQGDDELTEAV